MITPSFKITQCWEFVTIVIDAPFAKISDTEIEYEGREFLFSSKPYFLRIYLPKDVTHTEYGTAEYDAHKGIFTVQVPKATRGEHFENLDMITELLRPKGAQTAGPLVEEVEVEQNNNNDDVKGAVGGSGDCPSDAVVNVDDFPCGDDDKKLAKFGYGFAWKRHGVFSRLQEEIGRLIDLRIPDRVPIPRRFEICIETDMKNFNPEHYLADLFDPDETFTDSVLNFELASDDKDLITLSSADRDRMKELPKNRNWADLSHLVHQRVALSAVDIIFAYCYDLRTTDGEHTVESGWTIRKLSPSLSFFVQFPNAGQAVRSAYGRALTYPLYRRFDLCKKVEMDVRRIFKLGRTAILKCLLDVHAIFCTSGEYRYILNDLFITDYCIWIQQVPDDVIVETVSALLSLNVTLGSVYIDLEDLQLTGEMEKLSVTAEQDKSNRIRENTTSDQCLRAIYKHVGLDSDDDDEK